MSASNTKRIAKNTLMLYFRQILSMLVGLYTVRVVLETLGAEDYGIYNVVAGVVTMFSFLSGAMATASQRYFSFDLGKNDQQQLKKTFGVTLLIYLILILIIVILAETVGLWFIHTKLVVPPDRVIAARWVYQFSILSLALTIYTAPYMALIIAHEDMSIYAYISIIEVILKLGVVFIIPFFKIDTLIIYGFLLMLTVFINTSLYRIVCKIKYPESKVQLQFDRKLSREILSYTGWNVFGAVSGVFKNQGTTIVLNQFVGPVYNASRAIALQVSNAVISFSQNFSTALRPPIVKAYASEDYNKTINLIFKGSKITFFLMLILTTPLILNLEFVLKIWLVELPTDIVIFTKLILIESLIESLSFPMSAANQATGKIKYYQIMLGTANSLNLPIVFFILKLGYEPAAIFIGSITMTIVMLLIRTGFLKQIPTFSLKKIFYKVYTPLIAAVFFVCLLFSLISLKTATVFSFVINVVIQLTATGLIIFIIGLNSDEKKDLFKFLNKRKLR